MSLPTQTVGQLPTRLRNFFARYPPQIYSALVAQRPTPPEAEATPEETLPSPYTPDRDAKGAHKPSPEAYSPSKALLYSDSKARNPFLPRKLFTTGKWASPRYGLRQQADLVKLAIKYNVEPLLPLGPKSSEYKAARLAERGLRIKGTGIGQKVKGHKWERTMEARLEDRRKAMVEMPEMIRLWKQVSIHGNSAAHEIGADLFNREVTVVAGDSGRSGKQENSTHLVLSLVLSLLVDATLPFRCQLSTGFIGTPQRKHLYESLQGFGMGVSFDLRHFTICTIQSVGTEPNNVRKASEAISLLCA